MGWPGTRCCVAKWEERIVTLFEIADSQASALTVRARGAPKSHPGVLLETTQSCFVNRVPARHSVCKSPNSRPLDDRLSFSDMITPALLTGVLCYQPTASPSLRWSEAARYTPATGCSVVAEADVARRLRSRTHQQRWC